MFQRADSYLSQFDQIDRKERNPQYADAAILPGQQLKTGDLLYVAGHVNRAAVCVIAVEQRPGNLP